MKHLKPREASDFLHEHPQAVLIDCRSGQRSIAAGVELEKAGFTDVYNVLEGFEGPLDDTHHRGTLGGWRKEGLPWQQT